MEATALPAYCPLKKSFLLPFPVSASAILPSAVILFFREGGKQYAAEEKNKGKRTGLVSLRGRRMDKEEQGVVCRTPFVYPREAESRGESSKCYGYVHLVEIELFLMELYIFLSSFFSAA